MKDESNDQPILKAIQQLAAEEHRLYENGALTDADRARGLATLTLNWISAGICCGSVRLCGVLDVTPMRHVSEGPK